MNSTKSQYTKNRIRSTSSSIMEQNTAAPPDSPLAILPYLVLGSLPSISTRCPQGTLHHEILEGEGAAVLIDGDNLGIQVSCRADAGGLDEEVPYTLVTTLEVAERSRLSFTTRCEPAYRLKSAYHRDPKHVRSTVLQVGKYKTAIEGGGQEVIMYCVLMREADSRDQWWASACPRCLSHYPTLGWS
jgi:hypothetical protein